MIELSVVNDESSTLKAPSPTVIKVIGCGGGGSSTVNRIIQTGASDVEFIVLNTDVQALNISMAPKRLAIGQERTGGLGAGGNPEVGENSAKEDSEMISNVIKGANMVIITAGMGGGTGTGSAPIVAGLAHEQGVLTVAVVTTPFAFEGTTRMKNAQEGLKKLRENVDSLIIVPNQQIMKIVDKKVSFKQAFRLADDVLCQGIKGLTDIITKVGEPNIDFADVRTVMKDQGEALIGVGVAEGENRAIDAVQKAISNPLMEDRKLDGAKNIIVNVASTDDLSMVEVEEINNTIRASVNKNNDNIIWGQIYDPEMGDSVSVTVIATGFEDEGHSDFSSEKKNYLENSNTIDYGDYVKLSRGQGTINLDEPVLPQPSIKPPVVEEEAPSQVKKVEEKPVEQVATTSLHESLTRAVKSNRGLEAPDENIDRNDLKQPAIWRKSLQGLSKSINLTDDN